MNNYNYPPGSDVPWAPWNQENPKMEECFMCNGSGVSEDGMMLCKLCGGEGEIPIIKDEGEGEDPDYYEDYL